MCHTPVFIKEVLNKPKHFTSLKIRLTLASFSLSVSPSIHLSDPRRVSFHPHSRLLKLNNYWDWAQSGFGTVFLFSLFLHFCHSFIFFLTSRSSSVNYCREPFARILRERDELWSTWQHLELHLFIHFILLFIYLFIFSAYLFATYLPYKPRTWTNMKCKCQIVYIFALFFLFFSFFNHRH